MWVISSRLLQQSSAAPYLGRVVAPFGCSCAPSQLPTLVRCHKRQTNATQMKEQTRNTEVQINEEEIGKPLEKEFRIITVKMIKILENKMEKIEGSINKDIEELRNKHTNSTITEIKNTLESINIRISEAEERISELENKMVEISSEEHNKVKRMKRTEDSLRDIWDNTKCTNIRIIEEEEKKEGYEKIF